MKVLEVMSRDVACADTNDSIQQAAERMKELNVGDLPVIVNKEVVGFITDRDVAIRIVAHGLDPKTAKVVDAMTEGPVTCKEDDEIEDAARLMVAHKIRRLAVTDKNGKLSGIVSLIDLASRAGPAMANEILKVLAHR